MLNQRIGVFIALPLRALGQMSLQAELDEIGRMARALSRSPEMN